MSWWEKLGIITAPTPCERFAAAQRDDDDLPSPGKHFAQFAAGCFYGVERAFQRVPGVRKTEVGYTQGLIDNPTHEDVCSEATNHAQAVRLQYDPSQCSYEDLLNVFWATHDPTTLYRQGDDVGTHYRSGVYYYNFEQEKAAYESKERQRNMLKEEVVTEILPAKKFYLAEESHQKYLEKEEQAKRSAKKWFW